VSNTDFLLGDWYHHLDNVSWFCWYVGDVKCLSQRVNFGSSITRQRYALKAVVGERQWSTKVLFMRYVVRQFHLRLSQAIELMTAIH